MKIDTIKKIDKKESIHREGVSNWKSYYTIFAVALGLVFLINAVGTAYKLLDIKRDVTYAVEQGYNEFIENLEERDNFSEARQYFLEAKTTLNEITGSETFSKNKTIINSVEDIVHVAINLSEAAELTLEVEKEIDSYFQDINSKKNLGEIESNLDKALNLVDESGQLLAEVDFTLLKLQLPKAYYERLVTLKSEMNSLQSILTEIKENIHPLFIFLGDRYPNRALILLQNSNEIRPTGGFIGSLGFMDIDDGRMEKLDIVDVYDFDGQAFERAPNSEISMVSGQDWGIRDSNTSPDFEISARQAKQFLEEAKGPGVDSVVAIDLEFVREILKKTGPVKITGYALTLDEENFDVILSYLVESKTFGKTTPKAILKYIIADIENAIFEKIAPLELVDLIVKGIKGRHLQFYSDDEEVQEWFESLGAAGHLNVGAPYNDYLNVINISVGGNKTDMFMWQALKHETFIKEDGTLLNQLTIRRTHTWNADAENWIHDQLRAAGITHPHPEMLRILGKDTNKVMARVYVPYGATLKTAMGIDVEDISTMRDQVLVDDGFGKAMRSLTYFLLPMNTEMGESNEVVLVYELPSKLEFDPLDDYRLFFDKQAGFKSIDFEKYIYYGKDLRSYATNPTFTEQDGGELYRAALHTDKVLSVAVGEE